MKISNIIKDLRKEQGLTQEQIADYLGVSTPAVNKWEKGNTYPDITILPALARLLKTDLNTLLSFSDDLTDMEIRSIERTIFKTIQEKGYEEGFKVAIQKIREFPSCDPLIAKLSELLENTLFLVRKPDKYKKELEHLYERIAKSENEIIRSEALYKLTSRYIERGELDHAKQLIEELHITKYDNRIRIANLYQQQGYFDQASKILENKLMELLADIQSVLISMTDIAIEEKRLDDAQHLACVCEKITLEFDYMECTAYIAQLNCAAAMNDIDKCIALLNKLTKAMKKDWDISQSVFFRKLSAEDMKVANSYRENLLPVFIQGLETEEGLDFLRDNTDFQKTVERLKKLLD